MVGVWIYSQQVGENSQHALQFMYKMYTIVQEILIIKNNKLLGNPELGEPTEDYDVGQISWTSQTSLSQVVKGMTPLGAHQSRAGLRNTSVLLSSMGTLWFIIRESMQLNFSLGLATT